jgi:hypothetical protein
MRKAIFGFVALCFAGDVGAATLFSTPQVPANNGQLPYCLVTNVDTKPITVTMELVDFFGDTITPDFDGCPVPPATLAPRETCQVAASPNSQMSCRVTSSSKKIRAALNLFNGTTSTLEVQAPATR